MAERAAACAALGVADHRYLGGAGRWRDSGMALAGYGVRATARLALHPRAFSAPEAFAAEVEALVAVLEEVRPQVVVSYAEDGGYGHPDHVRAHEITTAAVTGMSGVPARLLYAVVGRVGHARRIAAMRAHATQVVVAPDERSFAMSNGVAQPVLPVEEYIAVDGRPSADLFGHGDG